MPASEGRTADGRRSLDGRAFHVTRRAPTATIGDDDNPVDMVGHHDRCIQSNRRATCPPQFSRIPPSTISPKDIPALRHDGHVVPAGMSGIVSSQANGSAVVFVRVGGDMHLQTWPIGFTEALTVLLHTETPNMPGRSA